MKNLMIDIETLDTRPSAVVLSIGAVFFDYDLGLGDSYYSGPIDIDGQLAKGRTVSQATLRWWMEQPVEVRDEAFGLNCEHDGESLYSTLLDFHHYIGKEMMLADENVKQLYVWGNGAGFDNVILEAAYDTMGIPVPWIPINNRCYRTEIANREFLVDVPPNLQRHHPLEDAIHQAKIMVARYKEECSGGACRRK